MMRSSYIKRFEMNALSYSSILEIGDAHMATPRNKALAVQKEGATYFVDSFNFADFPIYQRSFPQINNQIKLTQEHIHLNPKIKVESVFVMGTTGSSIVQLGNLNQIDSESKIKHIRILKDENDENEQS